MSEQANAAECYNNHNGREHDANEHRQLPVILTKVEFQKIDEFQRFQNNPVSLVIIYVPVIASLLFCPATIFAGKPMKMYFWPPDHVAEVPNINDAVAAFLMPAGLVYAIAYGFALQDVSAKFHDTDVLIDNQIASLRQTWQLVKCCQIISPKMKFIIARNITAMVIMYMKALTCTKAQSAGISGDDFFMQITRMFYIHIVCNMWDRAKPDTLCMRF